MPNLKRGMMGAAGVAGGPEGDPGELWTWGRNTYGMNGDGTVIHRSSPVQVGSLTDWVLIEANGYVVQAIKSDGSLWAWGISGQGEMGDGYRIHRSSPVQIGANTNWNKLGSSAGLGYGTNALTSDYKLFAWGGSDTAYGGNGDGTTIRRSSPVQIGGAVWAEASRGRRFQAAIRTDGTLWTWGDGANGRTGHGDVIDHSSPVQVGSLTNWSILFASEGGCHALKTDGTLWSWGEGAQGRIGDGTTITRSSPVQVGAETDWTALGGGHKHVLAIRNNGQLFSWGKNTSGQLGHNTGSSDAGYSKSSPVQVGALSTWKDVGNDGSTSMALKTDGTLWTWGQGLYGMTGHGDVIDRSSPVQVGSLTTWLAISSGGSGMLATKSAS